MATKTKGQYVRTKKHREFMSELNTGRVFSEEHKKNLSTALKGNSLLMGNSNWKKRDNEKMSACIKKAMQNTDLRKHLSKKSKEAWLQKRHIYLEAMKLRRPLSEEQKKNQRNACLKGAHHPNYIDGRSNIPYNNEFKKIRKSRVLHEQFNYTCQLCDDVITNNTMTKFLTLHHIDYDKENNNLYNLIPLCNFCNISVNKNREEWIHFFQDKRGEQNA